jgi:hypothetical protein
MAHSCLSPAELTLDGSALVVQVLEPRRRPRDERVQPVGLHPFRGGLALPTGAAPLRRSALGIGTGARRHLFTVLAPILLGGCDGYERFSLVSG